MKRIISAFIIFVLLFSVNVIALAESQSEFRVAATGIFKPIENSQFMQKEYITRADMAVIVARLTGIDDGLLSENNSRFTDVPVSHWAYKYINSLYYFGITNGFNDGTFRPDGFITCEEAVKMIITSLSYDVTAIQLGGYPQGYISAARSLKILKGVSASEGDLLTKDNIKLLAGNVLDVYPLETNVNGELTLSNLTIYEILSERNNLKEIKGVLTATEFTSIALPGSSASPETIAINGKEFKVKVDYTNLLGCYVQGYYKDNGSDDLAIVELFPIEARNDIVTFSAEDVSIRFDYADVSDGKVTRYQFDDGVIFVYNGKASYLEKQIYYGQYKFLDNNGDNLIDVVFIQEAESFIVERINERNNTLYFSDKQLFRGIGSFTFDYEDEDKVYVIKNTDGDLMEFGDIEVGDGVTFYASDDWMLVTAIVSKQKVEGEITEKGDETVKIGDTEYEIARNSKGEYTVGLELGDKGILVLDAVGNIIGFFGDKEAEYHFGYVTNVGRDHALRGTFQIEVVNAGKPIKEVTVKNGTETVKQHFMNSGFEIYNVSSNIILNGTRMKASAVELSSIKNTIISFSLNADGEIRELNTYSVPSAKSLESHTFNAKIVSFGGTSRGYMTNSSTQIICVPNEADEDDDYLVRLTLNDGSKSHKVYGISLDALSMVGTTPEEIEYIEALPVDILIIRADMDSSASVPIQSDADICIVGKVRHKRVVDDFGVEDFVYEIELLNKDNIVTELTASSGSAFSLAQRLRKGDLVRYNKDGYNRISGLEVLDSIQGLKEYGKTANGGFYGLVNEAHLYMYDYRNNAMIDRILMYYNDYSDVDVIRILREDGPPVYLYERSSGWIYPATADDIVPGNSKLYVYKPHGTEEAIVIIED